ncbi:hypothetical protein NVV94_12090 [Pseudomonas sp. LS1212]|uniref:hypothetical protein n=1 Tax=Pseudomonas sp. LS1212 TaxID=2972478 RepID=UPI00215CC9AC|nr:hypothetical protein [Pseudomonas sp. LS1212]UVJ46204.1 hypothetical protein NVV94_12090 [Pseudomonas sp. LS1212]
MSTTHDQAMKNVYHQVLQRMLSYFSIAQKTSLQLLIQRLIVAAGGIERIGGFRVMLAYGGGKDSSHALAFLRAAQLSIAARAPDTFDLRVATCRHAGITSAVMENIQRSYRALFADDDPRVEVLMVDDCQILPFDADARLSTATCKSNRMDLLMAGHLTGGQARASFCNSCYLSLADFYRRIMAWEGGVDLVVGADLPSEQARYLAWGRSTLRDAGLLRTEAAPRHGALLEQFEPLGHEYYRQLHGENHIGAAPLPSLPIEPRFLSIHDLVHVPNPAKSTLLTEFLGFRYADLAFAFSESDCANPLLMAHMRGLRAQFLQNRSYREGIDEYLQLAEAMMRRKRMPAELIEQALAAYRGEAGLKQRRQLATDFAQQAYGLSEVQLVCLLHAPFVSQGRDLEAFLRHCHPGMLVALPYLHKALQGKASPEPVMQWLVDISGLPQEALQRLYRMQRADGLDRSSLIARVRASDPDKCRIKAHDPRTGKTAFELVCGR